MLPRPPALRALLGAVAHPAVIAFAAAIGVAGVLAAIVLGSSDPTDPDRPTPVGTAILAPSDRDLGLLQTPTPSPTQPPTDAAATETPSEPSEPQPTPTPRVVMAPTAPPRPTMAVPPPTAPPAESTAPPADSAAPPPESTAPAAEVAQVVETGPSPTPLPNVRVTPTPPPLPTPTQTPSPPAPTADLPPAQVLEPVDLSPEPTRSTRQDRPPATEEADAEEDRRDAPPTPTAIRIVPGGPPDREPAGAARAEVPEGAAAVQAGDLGDEIQARVTGALSEAGITEGTGRGNRPVGLPAQTAEPDQPVQTIVLPPIEPVGAAPRVTVPTPRPPAIVARRPRAESRPAADVPVVVVPAPEISPRQPDSERSSGRSGGRGNDDDSPFCDTFPFCD